MNRGDEWLLKATAKVVFPVWSWLRNAAPGFEDPQEWLLWRLKDDAQPLSVSGPAVENLGVIQPGQTFYARRWFGERHPDIERAGFGTQTVMK